MTRAPVPGCVGVDTLDDTVPAPMYRMLHIPPFDGYGFFETIKPVKCRDEWYGRIRLMRLDQFWPLLDKLP